MKKISLLCLIILFMINMGISATSYNVEDKVEYLTAYDFLDGDFIQDLVDELRSNEINSRTMGNIDL